MAQMGFGRLVVNSLFTSVIIVLFITSGLIVNALWTIILPLWFAGRRDLYRACCKHITTAWFRSKSKHLPDCPRTVRGLSAHCRIDRWIDRISDLVIVFSYHFYSSGLGKMQIQSLFWRRNRNTCWERSWNLYCESSLYKWLDSWFYCSWTV